MTVQELIDELQAVKDKEQIVYRDDCRFVDLFEITTVRLTNEEDRDNTDVIGVVLCGY